ncbi:hypothetical protein L0N33_24820, partial [Roseburia faecis]|nr:hypothetical protein [Roseburia faecis]
ISTMPTSAAIAMAGAIVTTTAAPVAGMAAVMDTATDITKKRAYGLFFNGQILRFLFTSICP